MWHLVLRNYCKLKKFKIHWNGSFFINFLYIFAPSLCCLCKIYILDQPIPVNAFSSSILAKLGSDIARGKKIEKNWKKIINSKKNRFLVYQHPRLSMSVHKKCQPNRSSRLAGYRQHIYTNVLFYVDDKNIAEYKKSINVRCYARVCLYVLQLLYSDNFPGLNSCFICALLNWFIHNSI